jgi:hypothetical protein
MHSNHYMLHTHTFAMLCTLQTAHRRAAAGLLYRACDAQSSLYSINSISDAPPAAPPLASLLLAALLPMLPLLQVDAPGTTASTTTTTAATGTGTTAAAVSAAAAADSAAAATGAASNISSSTSKLSGRAGKAVVVPQENTGEFYALLAGLLHLRLETGAAPGDEEVLQLLELYCYHHSTDCSLAAIRTHCC